MVTHRESLRVELTRQQTICPRLRPLGHLHDDLPAVRAEMLTTHAGDMLADRR